MHAEKSDTAVDDFHAEFCHDPGNGSAASEINPAKLGGLEEDLIVVHYPADFCDEFGIGIAGAGFASGAGVFVEHEAFAEVGGIFFLKCFCVQRVVAGTYVGGKHLAVLECTANGKIRGISAECQQFCSHIFEETGLHAACTVAADLFLVHQQTAGGSFRRIHVKHGHQGSEGADAVVLAIGKNHAPVKSQISGFSRRDDLQFSGEEIFFLYLTGIQQQLQYIGLNGFFFLVLQRNAADEQVQVFTFDDPRGIFFPSGCLKDEPADL